MAALQALKSVIVAPRAEHTATVIFVHGLGDSGNGWKPVADMLLPSLPHVKWILPNAPEKPVTANGGAIMPSWFDIFSFGFTGEEDQQGMLNTASSLNKVISDEVDAGIKADRIVLGGFSQGGAMTVLTGLSSERRLAGLAVLSGWAPMTKTLKAMTTDTAKSLPIFWGHGRSDPMVRYDLAEQSTSFLQSQLGIKTASSIGEKGLSFHSYRGLGHSTSEGELDDLLTFLKKVLPSS